MRLTAIVVLSSSLAIAACNQAPAPGRGQQLAGTSENPAPAAGGSALPPGGDTAASAAPSRAAFTEVTIPEGTELPLVLDSSVASDKSKAEDPVRAHLARTVTVDGVPALPAGSTFDGVVTGAQRSGKVKGVAQLAMSFDRVTRAGDKERYRIETTSVGRTARTTRKKDAAKIGIGAAGGALVGALVGGGKGAAIGTAVGAGGGSAVVMSTRGEEVRLNKGAAVRVRLAEPLVVRVRRG